MAYLRILVRDFLKDTRGTMSVDAAICFPLLLWAFGATFLFWDAFRAKTINLKAAYTIADALSRETSAIDMNYLTGLNELYDFLTDSDTPVRLRVTTIAWDETNQQFEFIWSRTTSTSELPEHTIASLNLHSDQIPAMSMGDLAILVETEMDYVPFLNVGIPAQTFDNFVVTRPRFGPQLVWQNSDGSTIGYDDQDDSGDDLL
ncbi:MAG: pilus assembly protein [Pseudomonadota bacterium]